MTLLVRAYANLGRLDQARAWCEKALSTDRLNPGLHYLRSTIVQEQGSAEEAIVSLKRALYLDSDFALAHFGLGTLARQRGKAGAASRHFRNCLAALAPHPSQDIVPESGGLAVARLREIVESTLASGENT